MRAPLCVCVCVLLKGVCLCMCVCACVLPSRGQTRSLSTFHNNRTKKSQDGIFKKRTLVFIFLFFILLIKYEIKNSPDVRVRGAFTVTLHRLSCRHAKTHQGSICLNLLFISNSAAYCPTRA